MFLWGVTSAATQNRTLFDALSSAGRVAARPADTKYWLVLASLLVGALPVPSVLGQPAKKGPFWSEIRAFLQKDKAARPKSCQTLFVGSSSIRLWTNLKSDLAKRSVVRRGFGGAHLTHVLRYFDHLITPHRPREIVLYAGENDIAWGRSPDEVVMALQAFLKRKTQTLGVTPVYFVSIKPTIYHWDKRPVQKQANALIRKLAEQRSDLVYLDVASVMLDGGRPKDIFLGDKLHMNRDGYRLWAKVISDALNQEDIPEAPYCESRRRG